MTEELADMTTLAGLETGLRQTETPGGPGQARTGTPDGTFCPRCGGVRRMHVMDLFWQGAHREGLITDPHGDPVRLFEGPDALPAVFGLICVQCHSTIIVLVHEGPSGVEVVAVPSTYGGMSTPNTPAPVAYYLDQAQRSQALGALSAAVAMYRAALEQLLYKQGYRRGMLAQKIADLIGDEKPPRWLEDLDPAFLTVLKDLGNAAIHPNEGDVTKQAALDGALMLQLRALFVELLADVYEQPRLKSTRLAALQAAAETFKRQVSGG
jgi:hypothetical protein